MSEDCRAMVAQLEAGDPDPWGRAHLQSCRRCARLELAFRAGLAGFAEQTAGTPPPFSAVAHRARRRFALGRFAWGIAVAAALVLAVWTQLPRDGAGPPTTSEPPSSVASESGGRSPSGGAVPSGIATPRLAGRPLGVAPVSDGVPPAGPAGGPDTAHPTVLAPVAAGPNLRSQEPPLVEWRATGAVYSTRWTADALRLDLDSGTLDVDVERLAPGYTVSVRTPNLDATVVGTSFRVTAAEDGRTQVTVFEGTVRITPSAGGPSQLVTDGFVLVGPVHGARQPAGRHASQRAARAVNPARRPHVRPAADDRPGGSAAPASLGAIHTLPGEERPATSEPQPTSDAGAPEPAPTEAELVSRAREHLGRGRDEDAVALLAPLVGPRASAEVLWAWADAQRLSGRLPTARVAYARARARFGRRPPQGLLADQADVLERLSMPSAAAQAWEEYLRLAPTGPDAPRAHLFLARAGAGDHQRHWEALNRRWPHTPEGTAAFAALGRALLKAGRYDAAATHFRAGMATGPKPRREAAYIGFARAQLALGDTVGARRTLASYAVTFPQGARAREARRLSAALQ